MMGKIQVWYTPVPIVLENVLGSKKGQGLVEYALLLLLVALIAFAALGAMGITLDEMYYDQIPAALGG